MNFTNIPVNGQNVQTKQAQSYTAYKQEKDKEFITNDNHSVEATEHEKKVIAEYDKAKKNGTLELLSLDELFETL